MNITITITDENLNYLSKAETGSFDILLDHIAVLKKNYDRRVQMELDKGDYHGEGSKEEAF